jgi:hypothetical protein
MYLQAEKDFGSGYPEARIRGFGSVPKCHGTAILGPIYCGSGRIQILPGYFCGHFFESLKNSEVPYPYLRILDPGPDPGGNRIRMRTLVEIHISVKLLTVPYSALQRTCNKGLVSGAACKWDSVFVCFCNKSEKIYKTAFNRKGFGVRRFVTSNKTIKFLRGTVPLDDCFPFSFCICANRF